MATKRERPIEKDGKLSKMINSGDPKVMQAGLDKDAKKGGKMEEPHALTMRNRPKAKTVMS